MVGAEGQLKDLGRRDPVLDLHRPLVHDEHGARGYDEKDGHELQDSEIVMLFMEKQATEMNAPKGLCAHWFLSSSHLVSATTYVAVLVKSLPKTCV